MKKMNIRSKAELDQILDDLKDAEYQVAEVKKRRKKQKSAIAIYHQYLTAGSFPRY